MQILPDGVFKVEEGDADIVEAKTAVQGDGGEISFIGIQANGFAAEGASVLYGEGHEGLGVAVAGAGGGNAQGVDHQHLISLGGDGPGELGVLRGLDVVEVGNPHHLSVFLHDKEGTGLQSTACVRTGGVDPFDPVCVVDGSSLMVQDLVVDGLRPVQIRCCTFSNHSNSSCLLVISECIIQGQTKSVKMFCKKYGM